MQVSVIIVDAEKSKLTTYSSGNNEDLLLTNNMNYKQIEHFNSEDYHLMMYSDKIKDGDVKPFNEDQLANILSKNRNTEPEIGNILPKKRNKD